jgi:MFS superfamily sulfate permease-like transporter
VSTKEPEVLPPEEPTPRPRFSRNRLILAFALAALSDALSILFTLTPPLQWATDLVTAILLFVTLGWQWVLLPGLIMEAIPGLYVFPFWMLAVAATAVWGTVRPGTSEGPGRRGV